MGARAFTATAGAVSPGDESQPCWCGCHFCFCSRCEWGRASPRDRPSMRVPVSSPACAQQHVSGAHVHAHIRVPPPHACAPGMCLGSGVNLAAGRWDAQFGNDGSSRFSPALGWRGRNRKELVSAHKAHPRSCRAVGSLFVGLCSILVSRGLPTRGSETAAAGSPPRLQAGPCRATGAPGGLCFPSLPSACSKDMNLGQNGPSAWRVDGSLWGRRTGERRQTHPCVLLS